MPIGQPLHKTPGVVDAMDEVENEVQTQRSVLSLHRLISKQISPVDSAPLNVYEIKNYCYYGFSDSALRPKYWKVFLDYYSRNKFKTELFLKSRRESYAFYAGKTHEDFEGRDGCYRVIANDMDRTFVKPVDGEDVRMCRFLDQKAENTQETHRRVVERILRCYAVTNSSIRYVQGMNLVLVPIYYVMCKSEDADDRRHSEEDAFFCFNSLMAEIGENFTEDLDSSSTGITRKMLRVMQIVEEADPALHAAMLAKGLTEGGFHMKWIMLMFVSSFKLDDVLWLWDRLLSDGYRFEMLLYCCASVVVIMRSVIMEEDFDTCMELLQEPSIINIEAVFSAADQMRRQHYGKK